MTRILVVDDHPVVREGLASLLTGMGHDHIVQASNGRVALNLLEVSRFDLVILDVNMPDIDGIDLLGRIRARDRRTPVLMLSVCGEGQTALQAMQMGASGYLTKDTVFAELQTAITRVLGGNRYISSSISAHLLDLVDHDTFRPSHEKLTGREMQIMRLLLDGLTPADIGRKLNVSVKTVASHKAHIFGKIGVKSMVELVRYAIRHDLCP